MRKLIHTVALCLACWPALAQPKQALLITGVSPTSSDLQVSNRLGELGFVVTHVTGPNSATSQATGKDLIVISSTVSSGDVNVKFRDVAVPVLNWEQALQDDFDFVAPTGGNGETGGQTTITVTNNTHPLGAGMPLGDVVVYNTPGTITWGIPAATAIGIAQFVGQPSQLVLYGFETGATLFSGARTAAARRTHIFLQNDTFATLTPEGRNLFDAAVVWLANLPLGPVGISQEPADLTVIEGMTATFTVGVTGTPPFSVQWHSNGVDIAGATGLSYTTAPTTPADNGLRFSATITNALNGVVTREALLTVLTDTNPPTMVRALASAAEPIMSFDLLFSEPVNAADVTDTFVYELSNGASIATAALDPDQRTVHFTTSQPITNGTVVRLATAQIRDRAAIPNALLPGAPGSQVAITIVGIRRHRYNGITGTTIPDLTNNAKFPFFPDVIDFPTMFEDPSPSDDANNDFGVQLLGYVIPPVSGNYHFYLSADDNAVLYFSTNESAANKVLIANEPQWNNARQWLVTDRRNPAAPENRSSTRFPSGFSLVAGQRYYIEALMKEGGGGNNLGVAWQLPGDPPPANGSPPIAGLYLQPYNIAASIPAGQPADQVVLEGRTATFTTVPTGSPLLSMQWYENDVVIPGATGPTYTTPATVTNDTGKTYYLVASNSFSIVTSRVATLTVLIDTNPPTLLSVSSAAGMEIGLWFDEPVDATTSSDSLNYTVNGGAVPVATAVLRYDRQTVQLILGAPVAGTFTVAVSNITDLTTRNMMAGTVATGRVQGLTPIDLGTAGNPIVPGSTFTCREGEFEIIAGGADIWGNADQGHLAYETVTGDFDRRVLVARVDNTDVSAKGGLMVRETTNTDSRNLHAIVMPPPPARNIYETGTRRATAGATDGWGCCGFNNGNAPANHPNSWVRLLRIGDTFKAFASSNGLDWLQIGESTQDYPDTVVVGLAATAHNNDGRTNRVLFRNYGSFSYSNAMVTILQQPADASIDENHPVTFSVVAAVTGAPTNELSFQWLRSSGGGTFTNIPGANASSYTLFTTLADHGAQFQAAAFVSGASATSSVVTLTVTNDVTPPLVASATRGAQQTQVRVVFNEQVTATANDAFNYSINDGAFQVSTAVLGPDNQTVTLTTSTPLTNGTYYFLSVQSVTDLAGNTIVSNQTLIILLGARQTTGPQNLLVFEAENYDGIASAGGKNWEFVLTPAGYAGRGAMAALPDTGVNNNTGYSVNSPRLDYAASFLQGGTYYIWIRGAGPDGAGDSLHAGLDGAEIATSDRISGALNTGNANWIWTRDTADGAPATFPVTPGGHTVNIWMREDGIRVDRVLLTTDAGFTPTGLGPPESPVISAMPPAPMLTITRSGQTITVAWTGTVGRLQSAPAVGGPWTNVSNPTNPYTTQATEAQQYFRIVIP